MVHDNNVPVPTPVSEEKGLTKKLSLHYSNICQKPYDAWLIKGSCEQETF